MVHTPTFLPKLLFQLIWPCDRRADGQTDRTHVLSTHWDILPKLRKPPVLTMLDSFSSNMIMLTFPQRFFGSGLALDFFYYLAEVLIEYVRLVLLKIVIAFGGIHTFALFFTFWSMTLFAFTWFLPSKLLVIFFGIPSIPFFSLGVRWSSFLSWMAT